MRGHPFQSPDARRLALLFAIVYFAQGMIYLPEQVVAIVLAAFTWITTIPWFIKPLYDLLSDFVPLFGSRRRSYFLIMSGRAALAAVSVSLLPGVSYALLATMITLLWLGVGFTDVLTDALMVENERRAFAAAFALVACFPVVLSGLPRPRVGRRHHGGLRRDRHDHPARVHGPGGQGLPAPRRGHVLRAPDVGLQPRDAQRGVDRRQPLRLAGLCPAGADLDRLHRGRVVSGAAGAHRRHPGCRSGILALLPLDRLR